VLPPFAAWRHRGTRAGFEVAFLGVDPGGVRVEGHAVAIEDGRPYAVGYAIELDADWGTRSARVWGHSPAGRSAVALDSAGDARWTVDGAVVPELDGCCDVDLEASALTNAFPVRRLALAPGEGAEAPAAYVRAFDLGVLRIEQRYARVDDGAAEERYDYVSPTFDFRCELRCDEAGLPLEYPGIATRAC
jgi:hypothetical protein